MKNKKKADGGAVEAGGNPEVFKEAKERKFGGRATKSLGSIGGGAARMHLGRPGRKTGGRVGADKSPLSSAATVTSAEKGG